MFLICYIGINCTGLFVLGKFVILLLFIIAYQKTSLKQFGALKFELRQQKAKLEKIENILTHNVGVLPMASATPATRLDEPTASHVQWARMLPFKTDDDMAAAEHLLEDEAKMDSFVS